MKINDAGLALIKAHEGVRLKAYRDPVGIWTIGYGHTSAAGHPHVREGMTITPAEAESILRNDIAKFERYVMDEVGVPLNENQFAALVSFCFNVGPGAFRGSSVLRYVNDRDFAGVPGRLALWNKGGGKVWPGLVRRRADEGKLFMAPVASAQPVQRPYADAGIPPPPDVEIIPTSGPAPVNPKPLHKSRTMAGAVASEAAGAALVVDSTTEIATAAQQAEGSISAGTVFGLVIGLLIMFGAGVAIFARWDDGGRPLPGFLERRWRKEPD